MKELKLECVVCKHKFEVSTKIEDIYFHMREKHGIDLLKPFVKLGE